VLDDALVKALVAARQERERWLRGQLVDERVVEQPSAELERDHPPLRRQLDGINFVAGAQRRLHDVDAQHHPRPAAERRVVDLAPAQRRVVARVDAVDRRAAGQDVGQAALLKAPAVLYFGLMMALSARVARSANME